MSPRKITIDVDEEVAAMFVMASNFYLRDFRRRCRFYNPDVLPRWEQSIEDLRRGILQLQRGEVIR